MLLFCLPFAGRAEGYVVTPVSLVLQADSAQGLFHLFNQSGKPLQVQIDVQSWAQRNNDNIQDLTTDFIVSPRFAVLPAGGSQVVRVALRHPLPSSAELSYRVLFRQVAAPAAPSSEVLLNYSVPLFLEPATVVAAQLEWTLSLSASGTLTLRISNHGRHHSKLHFDSLGNDSLHLPMPTDYGLRYVLPGATREIHWSPPASLHAGDRLTLSVQVDGKPQQMPLTVLQH